MVQLGIARVTFTSYLLRESSKIWDKTFLFWQQDHIYIYNLSNIYLGIRVLYGIYQTKTSVDQRKVVLRRCFMRTTIYYILIQWGIYQKDIGYPLVIQQFNIEKMPMQDHGKSSTVWWFCMTIIYKIYKRV